jgi:hypothetical protein
VIDFPETPLYTRLLKGGCIEMSAKWEYMIFNVPPDNIGAEHAFNQFGEEGWELVAVIHHTSSKSFDEAKISDYFAFFKKQR